MLTPLDTNKLRNLDATASTTGLTVEVLMERAGMALAKFLSEKIKKETSVLFLCGIGNNGGDGFVAARHLHHKGFKVSVLISNEIKQTAANTNKKILEHMSIPINIWKKGFSFTPYNIIVDCLLGYGQKKSPEGNVLDIIKEVNGKTCYACDHPTGLCTDTGEIFEHHLVAKETLSISAPKIGFIDGKSICGKITIVGIGIPAHVYELVGVEKFLIEGEETFP